MTWDERFQNETLRRLRRRLHDQGVQETGALMREIAIEIERIVAEYSAMIVDEKTRPHLRLTACVLACYQALAAGPLDRDQALEWVEEAFVSIGRTMLTFYTRAILMTSRDPFAAITSASRRSIAQYGSAWTFRVEETDTSFAMISTKCFYHEFFMAAGCPELTRIFCAWDENWIRPIDPAKYRVVFERPTTMGTGGSECPFIFRRVAPGSGDLNPDEVP
jgi:hypothetical protein